MLSLKNIGLKYVQDSPDILFNAAISQLRINDLRSKEKLDNVILCNSDA